MSRTRFLQIVFDKPMQSYDVPKLRAAIIEKTQRMSDLFHNHLGDKTFIYRYPLIQYKIKDRRPCLVCLKEATEDIHYLLRERDFSFNINGTHYDLEIEDVRLRYVNIQTFDKLFTYNIHNYISLNQDNFELYKRLESLVEKIAFLEKMLCKHLEIFMEEMGAEAPFPLKCQIVVIKNEKYIRYKNVFHLTFSLNFRSNLIIPNYVGIGKGVSVGFGIIKKLGEGRPSSRRNNKED